MPKIRKLAVVALAAMAVSAACGVTSASALTWGSFKSSQENPSLSSPSASTMTIVSGSEVQCSSWLSGQLTGSSSTSMSLHPTITCSKPFGWIPVTVNTEGCKFKFSALNNSIKLKDCSSGAMTVKWSAPTLLECVISIPNQEDVNYDAQYTNTADRSYLDVNVAHSFNSSVTVSKGACPLETRENAPFRFEADYKVYANEGLAEFWWVPSSIE